MCYIKLVWYNIDVRYTHTDTINFCSKKVMTPLFLGQKRHDPFFPGKSCIFIYGIFSQNTAFFEKSWIETHIKSHILVIMHQRSILYDKPFLRNEDPWKKAIAFFHFFLFLTDFLFIFLKNDKKYPQNRLLCTKIEYKTIFLR